MHTTVNPYLQVTQPVAVVVVSFASHMADLLFGKLGALLEWLCRSCSCARHCPRSSGDHWTTPPATAVSHDAAVVADWSQASATPEGVPHSLAE